MLGKGNREIKYSNKDFGELRNLMVNHAKNYFPNTYADFNESSVGMMFIEMAAVVGDVLSYYQDVQLQESFLYTVNEKINLYNLSQGMGYKVKTTTPAQVDLDIFQLLPSIGEGESTVPDFTYALTIRENMQVSTDDGTSFYTTNQVDFRFSSSYDPTETSVYSVNVDGSIEYYLLKKKVKAISGRLVTETYDFGQAKIYDKIVLPDENISEIISVTDADNDTWYEVPYLAQDLVPISMRNIPYNDPLLSQYRSSVPYLLCYKQTEKRFVSRLRKDDRTEIQFGSGLSSEADEEIVPNPYNVAIGLDYFRRAEDISIDPMNFLYTKTYGRTPSDTTLTVVYSMANGISDNVKADSLINIDSITIENLHEAYNQSVLDTIKDSISCNNPFAAYGGSNRVPIDVIREEAMANFASQNRAVTKDDYILRCYTLPAKFGSISKAYIEQDTQMSNWNDVDRLPNPFSLNLYILSYDSNKNFVPCNLAIKENLRQYLTQYRLMTDSINIKDPYIINIGIEFEIVTRPAYNSYEVIFKCVSTVKDLFAPEKREIGAPIILSSIYTELDKVEGVQTVQSVNITNLYDINQGYSGNIYDIETAKRNGVIYPSMDACIFEVKYPGRDIKGRVIDI